MGEPNLKVNTDQLYWDVATVTVPEVPKVEPGGDPMSLVVSTVMPTIAGDLTTKVAATKAREQKFADNLTSAKHSYQNTDSTAKQDIQTAAASTDVNSSGVSGGSQAANATAGGGDSSQLGQIMGMAMQGAQQAVQVPTQLAGALGQIPQGITQGVQSLMQQFGQFSGSGADSADKAGAQGNQLGTGAPGASTNPANGGDPKEADKDSKQATENKQPNDEDNHRNRAGASGGDDGQRAPLPERNGPPTIGAAPGSSRPKVSPEVAL
jgi:hypothetical protein